MIHVIVNTSLKMDHFFVIINESFLSSQKTFHATTVCQTTNKKTRTRKQ